MEDTEDLAQAYFVRLLEKGYLGDFRRESGRFRSFLLASVSHFLSNEWDRERAAKRGGGRRLLSLDTEGAEDSLRREPVDGATPERVFERQWVAATLARCLDVLGEERLVRGGEVGEDLPLGHHLDGEHADGRRGDLREEGAARAPDVGQGGQLGDERGFVFGEVGLDRVLEFVRHRKASLRLVLT